MRAIKLRTEYMKNPRGLDICAPFLSWNCSEGIRQTAYQIMAVSERKIVWDSGKVISGEMGCRYGGTLTSRQQVTWKVCLWDETGEPGPWSEEATFEMAFLEKECWQAKWINPELTLDETQRQPASYLKKRFPLDTWKSGRLYITCHGVYAAYLNGKRVSDFVLAPGTTEYAKRLHYQVYDVSEALQRGENELLVVLGDGWYRGNNGIDGNCNLFGKDIALLCQLETDGRIQAISDESWLAAQDGAIRFGDLQDGEVYEAFRGTGTNYHGVTVEEYGYDNLMCSNNVAVHEQESFQPKILKTPNGETVLDFGQNMAGYVEFTVEAQQGQKIHLIHGETLDHEGNFTNANFQPTGRKRKWIRQEIRYTCKEGANHYKPSFCFFGFQYVKLVTEIPVENFTFTAHAVYSDMEQTGWFTCSNENVNQLVRNTIWSQKGNFLDIPTDCPTRERQGWTGDAGIFAETGLYLMDCFPVLRKWLADVRCTQKNEGIIRGVAPRTDDGSRISGMLDGAAGWAEACVIVPYALYRATGNKLFLEENYEMMQRWMDFAEKRARKSRWRRALSRNPHKKYIVDTGFHWGEWCEPDVSTLHALLHNIFHGAPELATGYFGYSAGLMAEIAGVLEKKEDSRHYAALHEKIKAAYHTVALPGGTVQSNRQASYVRPVALKLLTQEECRETVAGLNQRIVENGYHLNTGFLSTPYLCEVLTEYGYRETAYKLLLQDTCPSWLYAVKMGANTIWESWNGKLPDGSIRDSLNHYSYGAVVGWLFRGVCGIRVQGNHITIAPKPHRLLEHAEAAFDSPLGMIRSAWQYGENSITYTIEIPANCEATVVLDGEKKKLTAGKYCFAKELAL